MKTLQNTLAQVENRAFVIAPRKEKEQAAKDIDAIIDHYAEKVQV